jgi:hypothetical protein
MRVCFTLSTGVRCCINEHGSTVIGGQAGSLLREGDFEVVREFEAFFLGSSEARKVTREQLCAIAHTGRRTPNHSVPTVKAASLLQSVQ